MITFDKILVCIDLGAADQSIIKNACHIAKKAGTKQVTFLNVVREFNLPDSLVKEFPDLVSKAIDERREQLQKAIDDGFDCSEVNTRILIKQGNATKEILAASVEDGSDLIVLGRKKDSESVLSTRIARRAACNLLLIPEQGVLSFDKIHVPVDFSNYSDLSLETALALTHDSKAEISLQNVYHVPSSYRYSGKSFEEFGKIMEENSNKDLQVLVRTVSPQNQKVKAIHTNDQGQNVIKLIYDEAKRNNANLIVMGAKGRTAASALFIGSKAERMILTNHEIPLLVIRKKGANAGIIESLQDI